MRDIKRDVCDFVVGLDMRTALFFGGVLLVCISFPHVITGPDELMLFPTTSSWCCTYIPAPAEYDWAMYALNVAIFLMGIVVVVLSWIVGPANNGDT